MSITEQTENMINNMLFSLWMVLTDQWWSQYMFLYGSNSQYLITFAAVFKYFASIWVFQVYLNTSECGSICNVFKYFNIVFVTTLSVTCRHSPHHCNALNNLKCADVALKGTHSLRLDVRQCFGSRLIFGHYKKLRAAASTGVWGSHIVTFL